ncbi:Nonribosomal peptide synthetase ftmPS [Trichinella pseudospiralis]
MPRPCRRSIHSAAQQYSGQLPSRPAPACYINPLSGHQCVRSRLEKSQIVKHGRRSLLPLFNTDVTSHLPWMTD